MRIPKLRSSLSDALRMTTRRVVAKCYLAYLAACSGRTMTSTLDGYCFEVVDGFAWLSGSQRPWLKIFATNVCGLQS